MISQTDSSLQVEVVKGRKRTSYYYRCSAGHRVYSPKQLSSQKEVDEKCRYCLKQDLEDWKESIGY